MKFRNLFLSGALALTVLSGCGSTNDKDEKTTITFWHAMNGEQEKTLEELVNKFEKANPNIDVELQNQSSYSDLQSKLTTAKGSTSTLPNITQAYGDWLEDSINDGLVANLDVNTSDYVSAYIEPLMKNGKVYGVPFCKSTEILVYNKEIVKELGLKIPTTPKEYYEFCKTIYEKTGIQGGGFDHLGNYYQTQLKNNGADLNEDTDLLSKESVSASKYLQDGVQNKYFRLAGTDQYLSNAFGSKRVASYIGTNGGLSFTEKLTEGKFEFGIAVSPMGKTIQQGTDLFVFNKSEKENKASEKLVEFLTNADSQTTWALNTGYLPSNVKALESKEYAKYKYASVLTEASKNLYTEPINANRNKLYNTSLKYMEMIANGKDIEDVLKQYSKEKERIFKRGE